MNVAEHFGARAEGYENAAHRWQAERAVAHAMLSPGQRALDIATGTGLVARAVARRFEGEGEVVGIDAASGMIAHAESIPCVGVRYVVGDGVDLPVGLGRFDRVLCVAGLPYLGDAALALRRWKAVCRDDARIIITVPAERGLVPFALLQDAAAQEGVALQNPDAGIGTAAALVAIADQVALEVDARVEEVFDAGPLSGDPATVLERFLDLGHAEPLARAPAAQRQAVSRRFRTAYQHARGAPDLQRVVFARLK